MANVFKTGLMASNQLDTMLASVIVRDANDAEIEVKDGSLVVLGDLADDTTYSTFAASLPAVDYNTYYAAAPAAATDEVLIVDYAGISEGEIAGNYYREGIKLYDLVAPAGTIVRARRLALHDKFWLGADNFASAPTVGQFAAATANAFTHTPAATLPAAGYAIKVLAAEDLTAGMATKGKIYLVEVVQL